MEFRSSVRIAKALEEMGCDEVLVGDAVCDRDNCLGVPPQAELPDEPKGYISRTIPCWPPESDPMAGSPATSRTSPPARRPSTTPVSISRSAPWSPASQPSPDWQPPRWDNGDITKRSSCRRRGRSFALEGLCKKDAG